jgi:restriction system protein
VDIFGSALSILVLAWPIGATLAVLAVLRVVSYVLRWYRLVRAGMNQLDRMTGRQFAERLEDMFTRLGYGVKLVSARRDGSAVLVLTGDDFTTIVRAEQRTSGRVASPSVQAAVAAQAKYNCAAALVVTNQEYTPKAKALAVANDVVLWNRDALAQMLQASRTGEPEPAMAARKRAA